MSLYGLCSYWPFGIVLTSRQISTNITRPSGQEVTLFWSMHQTTGLVSLNAFAVVGDDPTYALEKLPLDASADFPCNDAGFISNIFTLLDPQAAS